ncbi:MAG TPA: hypothetical protein VHI13_08935 [Candidatus Kapabacteria bacterium]|nr:hypothetical protein [Candidatus Kapabacteria bacterium]
MSMLPSPIVRYLLLLAAASAAAGPFAGSARAQSDSTGPTGILAVDLRAERLRVSPPGVNAITAEGEARHPKSVALAGVLSGLLPGAGQVYAEAPLWRTILYGGIEATGLTLYFVFAQQGVNATNNFQNYADAHWDVTRYVDWIAEHYQSWDNQDVDKAAASQALAAIYLSHDPSLPPWQRIDFTQLNKLERAVNGGFSHTLPVHGDQQYYEELGKYFQYRSGWDDHEPHSDSLIFDPSRVTPHNLDYVSQREHANALGSYAYTSLGVVVINHIVSLVDAVLTARGYNVSLHSETHGMLMPNGTIEIVPAITMSYRF